MTSDTGRYATPAGLGSAVPIWTIAGLCGLGLALRIWYANWPLWVDEIWSLKDLVPIRHFWQILWGISQDNNHYLYSIYLFFAYPLSHDEVWLRAPSILAGVAAIPLMAQLGGRDRAAALAAAAMTTVSAFLVTYSAQARGYALAAVFWIMAYRQLEKAMNAPTSRARWLFAVAIGTAAFCHLATLVVACLFGVAAFCEFLRRQRNILEAVRASLQLFWPTLIGFAPIMLCLVAGYAEIGGFIVNFVRPYSSVAAFAAFSQMIVSTLEGTLTPLLIISAVPLVAIGAIVVLRESAIPSFRRISYAVMLFGLPALVLIARPPNSHIPRYYLISAVFLILATADLFAILWRKGGIRRGAAIAGAIVLAIGNLHALAAAKEANSAAWPEALAAIAASPSQTVGTNFDFNVREFVGHYNRLHDKPLQLVGSELACDKAPEWYIVETEAAAQPETISVDASRPDGGHCGLRYVLTSAYGDSTFFESRWFLYRAKSPRQNN
jgi:hypothetical protein